MARILLVGDENRKAAAEAIGDPGRHEIVEVPDGPAAVAALGRGQFDVVVMAERHIAELANELGVERDALRETFDVFDEALLLLDSGGRVQIENAAGRKLREAPARDDGEGAIRDDLVELAREAISTR